MYKFIDKEYEVLSKPLTRAEVMRTMDKNGFIDGVIRVPLSYLIGTGSMEFSGMLAKMFTRRGKLSHIKYKLVGCGDSDEVLLHVSGRADDAVDALKDILEDIDIELPEMFLFKTTLQDPMTYKTVYRADRINEYGDYRVSWKSRRNDPDSLTDSEHYTEKEVMYFVSSKEWMLIEDPFPVRRKWILTDDDCLQHVCQESDTKFHLIELAQYGPNTKRYEVYEDTIDVRDYLDNMTDETISILGYFGYKGLEDVREKYGEAANKIIAECIFEHYGSRHANQLMTGTRAKAEQAIFDFIGGIK